VYLPIALAALLSSNGVTVVLVEAPSLPPKHLAAVQESLSRAAASFSPCLSVQDRDKPGEVSLRWKGDSFETDGSSRFHAACLTSMVEDALRPVLKPFPEGLELKLTLDGSLSASDVKARAKGLNAFALDVCKAMDRRAGAPASQQSWGALADALGARGVKVPESGIGALSKPELTALYLAIVRSTLPSEVAAYLASILNTNPRDHATILLLVLNQFAQPEWPELKYPLQFPPQCAAAEKTFNALRAKP
jgi:hypothetical protein